MRINKTDWALGTLSAELQNGVMHEYESFTALTQQAPIRYAAIEQQLQTLEATKPASTAQSNDFYFGG